MLDPELSSNIKEILPVVEDHLQSLLDIDRHGAYEELIFGVAQERQARAFEYLSRLVNYCPKYVSFSINADSGKMHYQKGYESFELTSSYRLKDVTVYSFTPSGYKSPTIWVTLLPYSTVIDVRDPDIGFEAMHSTKPVSEEMLVSQLKFTDSQLYNLFCIRGHIDKQRIFSNVRHIFKHLYLRYKNDGNAD